ncbi:hypothetical protein N7532_009951 [Penicillium argentinense]|uniref:Fungal specific transcription factor n=1 Tax=Penicillium argentinense TaxID=1131581 RepID=A0A9W9ENW5_9EURO|nr:uncharacterized protein N7532_009951 [Penicillium argentinense]KAJ5085180.1 hypothetical protein N7532_009951 [Penicillium argentinense]
MGDLLSSRWAPDGSGRYNGTSTTPSLRRPRSETPLLNHSSYPSQSRSPAPAPSTGLLPPHEELARFMKIVSRLRWKLPFLAEAYRLATIPIDQAVSSESLAHAEIMFKIDFHEYYALLERAIVHLLAVFNITVSARAHLQNGASGRAGLHRYHANVLQALQEEYTPLTPVLGSGKAHEMLRKAKELRNRWKTADMTADEKERDLIGDRDESSSLASYNFEEIVLGIFAGLEEGYARAQAHVDLCQKPGDHGQEGSGTEDDWGFMVDAMDWEAV